jgi:hypothetical protein
LRSWSARLKRAGVVGAIAVGAVVAMPAAAFANHGAYMQHSVHALYEDCIKTATILNLNPLDDWSDANCVKYGQNPGALGPWAVIAKHG